MRFKFKKNFHPHPSLRLTNGLFKFLQFLIDALASTWRFSFVGGKIAENAITVFWHDQIYPLSKYMQNTNSVALVSLSRDGEFAVSLVKMWGHDFLRGSSSKNSRETLRTLIATAKKRKVFLTPDGPRGPRHKMKLGALMAAQKAKVPFYLLKAEAHGYRFKKSWDKFLIPWPFTKITVYLSQPYFIAENLGRAELEKLAQQFELWMGV